MSLDDDMLEINKNIVTAVVGRMPEIPYEEADRRLWLKTVSGTAEDLTELVAFTLPSQIRARLDLSNEMEVYRDGSETKKTVAVRLIGEKMHNGKCWLCVQTQWGREKISVEEAEKLWQDNPPSQDRSLYQQDGDLNDTYGLELYRTEFVRTSPRAMQVRKNAKDILKGKDRDVLLYRELQDWTHEGRTGKLKVAQYVERFDGELDFESLPEDSSASKTKPRRKPKAATRKAEPAPKEDDDWGDDESDDWGDDETPAFTSFHELREEAKQLGLTAKQVTEAAKSLGVTAKDKDDPDNLAKIWAKLS